MLRAQRAAFILVLATLALPGCGESSGVGTTNTEATSTSSNGTTTSAAPATTSSTATTSTATATAPPAQAEAPSRAPLGRSQLIAKGDAICAQLNSQLGANVVGKTDGYAGVLLQAAAYERAERAELAKLVPPSSMAKAWHSFVLETERWGNNTAALGSAAAKSSHFTLGGPLAATTTKIHSKLVSIAKRAGFKDCAEIQQ